MNISTNRIRATVRNMAEQNELGPIQAERLSVLSQVFALGLPEAGTRIGANLLAVETRPNLGPRVSPLSVTIEDIEGQVAELRSLADKDIERKRRIATGIIGALATASAAAFVGPGGPAAASAFLTALDTIEGVVS